MNANGDITLRPEAPADYREVEDLTRAAFRDMKLPGGIQHVCNEHVLAHKMRAHPAFVRELDYVAVDGGGRIAGNILYLKNKIVTPDGREHEVLTFGPLSVLPSCQRRGIGGRLVRKTIEEAKRQGYRAVLIMGHPEYYPRFGFREAKDYGITLHDGTNISAFMALELYPGALEGMQGRYIEDPVYDISSEELAEFENRYADAPQALRAAELG